MIDETKEMICISAGDLVDIMIRVGHETLDTIARADRGAALISTATISLFQTYLTKALIPNGREVILKNRKKI